MFKIKKYTQDLAGEWNSFVEKTKNGTFLFNRNYMDYQSERLQDNSLLIYYNDKLYTVLPANRVGDVLYSHQGLTYGGFIMSERVTATNMIRIFELLNKYLKDNGISRVIYKPVPLIYHLIPAQEDLYALFKVNARIVERNISSTIYQNSKIKFSRLRRRGISKAQSNNLVISESEDYAGFWNILTKNLMERHHVKPVHSLNEISSLHSLFPDNIKLYLAYKDDTLLAGVVVYITKQVIHPQYCSANLMGKELGALDFIYDYLINTEYVDVPVFDFGRSTEKNGCHLNEGLIFQKEGFGARGVIYDTYEYKL